MELHMIIFTAIGTVLGVLYMHMKYKSHKIGKIVDEAKQLEKIANELYSHKSHTDNKFIDIDNKFNDVEKKLSDNNKNSAIQNENFQKMNLNLVKLNESFSNQAKQQKETNTLIDKIFNKIDAFHIYDKEIALIKQDLNQMKVFFDINSGKE